VRFLLPEDAAPAVRDVEASDVLVASASEVLFN